MSTDYSCSACGRSLEVTDADGSAISLAPCTWCLARAKDGCPVDPKVGEKDCQQERKDVPESEPIRCPVSGCGFNANMDQYQKDIERPLCLESTRSHAGEDAWRDMDGFDRDEELSRLRRALHEVKLMYRKQGWERHQPWNLKVDPKAPEIINHAKAVRYISILQLVAESADNLDFLLTHLGSLPQAWASSRTVTERK